MIFIQVINNGLTFLKNNINTKTLTITINQIYNPLNKISNNN